MSDGERDPAGTRSRGTLAFTLSSPGGPDAPRAPYEEQFDELWRRAHLVAYQVLGSRAAAEDAAQETLARAYRWWPRISGPPQAWVARVAYRVAIDEVRKAGRRRFTALDENAATTTDTHQAERVDLRRALQRLPKRQRETVVLRYLADQSEADTAAALGLSVVTVRKHAARGLATLRERLALPLEES